MRFVFFADLHLDCHFAWAPPRVGRQRRQSLRDTLEAIMRLADEVDADAILSGGDLYEHDRFTPDTASFLQKTFNETSRAVILAPGNHDWLGPESLYHRVSWASHVSLFTESRLRPIELAEGLTLWGAAHRAPANTDGFLDDFRVDRGGINLALFHGSELGSFHVEGDDSKRPHAPFDATAIPKTGLHHAFVGHYHQPRDGEFHTYPGNPDPLTFGESGERAAVVVDVGADGTIHRQRRRVAQSQMHDLSVDVTGCASRQDVRHRVAEALEGVAGLVRLTVQGELDPDVDLHAATDLTSTSLGVADRVPVVVVRRGALRVAYDLDTLQTEQTVRGQFVRDVLEAGLDPEDTRRVITTGLRALDGRDDLEVA